MAIKVIRICDDCGEKHTQIIDENIVDYSCPVKFICSDCILKESKRQDNIRILDDLQSKENDGRGVSCICSIISFLRRKEYNNAKRVYQYDGDKIRQYPEIQDWLSNNFGCRTHLKKNCDNWLCK